MGYKLRAYNIFFDAQEKVGSKEVGEANTKKKKDSQNFAGAFLSLGGMRIYNQDYITSSQGPIILRK